MDRKIAVARCHEIQLAMKDIEAARLERIPEIGMAVQLALHIRGLPILDYSLVKLVATTLIGADSTPFGHSAHADPDTCSTIIRTGSRSAATQGWHC